jgi:hypothetical protein
VQRRVADFLQKEQRAKDTLFSFISLLFLLEKIGSFNN